MITSGSEQFAEYSNVKNYPLLTNYNTVTCINVLYICSLSLSLYKCLYGVFVHTSDGELYFVVDSCARSFVLELISVSFVLKNSDGIV